jgi:hypothetical protein
MTLKALLYSVILSIGSGNAAGRAAGADPYQAMGSFTSQVLERDYAGYELAMFSHIGAQSASIAHFVLTTLS